MTKQKMNKSSTHYDDMLWALAPLVICGSVLYGVRVLLVCAVALATARVIDVWAALWRKCEIDSADRSSVVAALTFCMLLPVSIPLHIVIMTVALVTLVGKYIFGGKDVYPFSLAALSMCIAAVNWPTEVFKVVPPFSEVNFWTGASASTVSGAGTIKMGGLPYVSTWNLLLGNYASTIGASFVLIIIAVAIFLLVNKRITWHIPVTFLLTCSLIAILFPRIYGISRFDSFKLEILNGALIFCAVFMLNEPATTPKTPQAKIVFGVLAGILGMLFRYFGSYEIGICFALLLVNATEGFFDRVVAAPAVTQFIYHAKSRIKLQQKMYAQQHTLPQKELPMDQNPIAQVAPATQEQKVQPINTQTDKPEETLQMPVQAVAPIQEPKIEPKKEEITPPKVAKPRGRPKKPSAQPSSEILPKIEVIEQPETSAEMQKEIPEDAKKTNQNKSSSWVNTTESKEPVTFQQISFVPMEQEETAIKKSTKKSTSAKNKAGGEKTMYKKAKSVKKEAQTTLDIISQAEDDIDQVLFSTQTIDMEEALRIFDEKYGSGGK